MRPLPGAHTEETSEDIEEVELDESRDSNEEAGADTQEKPKDREEANLDEA
jgi:hypothetical protein